MKSRPILFNAPMVRALLDGTKTQTRRVVTLRQQAVISLDGSACYPRKEYYGAPGDTLWVREAWGTWRSVDNLSPVEVGEIDRNELKLWYRARGDQNRGELGKWRPSIHMPRWASRITLEVVDVRVERLQDITEDDARAEGITGPHDVGYKAFRVPGDSKPRFSSAVAAFESLWESINGTWAANPYVWRIEFKRVKP